jgi:hypothetical protein
LPRKNSNRNREADIMGNASELKDLNESLKRITKLKDGNHHIDTYEEFCYRQFEISYLHNLFCIFFSIFCQFFLLISRLDRIEEMILKMEQMYDYVDSTD